MNGNELDTLARRARLDLALRDFPEDVAAAMALADGCAEHLKRVIPEAVEPWPPMQVPTDE